MKLITRCFALLMLAMLLAPEIAEAQPVKNQPKPAAPSVVASQREFLDNVDKSRKYCIFNNLLDPPGWPVGHQDNFYFWAPYWRHLQGLHSPNYKDKFVHVPFADETFQKYNILDFDLVVFPMGEHMLQSTTSGGGHKIVSVINDLLDAGKRVVIYNRLCLNTYSSDPEAKEFIENTIGIIHKGNQLLYQGNTIIPRATKGKADDPIGLNEYRQGNAIGIASDGTEHPAPINYEYLEFFHSKDEEVYETCDYIADKMDKNYSQPTDMATGIRRIFENKARLVFLSYGMENLHFSNIVTQTLEACASWALWNDIEDGAALEFINGTDVDFGKVLMGESRKKSIMMSNKGSETLIIDKIEINDLGFEGSFVPETEDVIKTPLEIEPGAAKALPFVFTPVTEGSHLIDIVFYTNEPKEGGGFGKIRTIYLTGFGGEQFFENQKIVTSHDILDFGNVPPGKHFERDLEVHNEGKKDLWFYSYKIKYQDTEFEQDEPFSLRHSFEAQNIKSGDYYTMRLQFFPLVEYDGTVTATLELHSEDPETPIKEVILKATALPGGNAEIEVSVEEALDFGEVLGPSTKGVTISNTGEDVLKINAIDITGGEENIFSVKTGGDLETVAPQGSEDIEIMFSPKEDNKTYEATLEIKSNASNNNELAIDMMGKSGTLGVAEEVTADGKFKLQLMPNPVKGAAKIRYSYSGSGTADADIYILGIDGSRIAGIYTGGIAKGQYDTQFDVSNLASGKYILAAEINGRFIQLPLVIAK